MTSDPQAKGRIALGYAAFIKKRWGKEGYEKCQKDVKIDFASLKDEMWYPNSLPTNLLIWIEKNYGIDYCRQAGFSVVADRGVITYAARIAGVKKVLERGVDEFRESFKDGGVSVELGDKRAVLSISDINISPCSCQAWIGAFQGILHITKAKGTVKEIACEHKGAKACQYEITWS